MRRRLAWVLLRLAHVVNRVALRLLMRSYDLSDRAERLHPATPRPARMSPADYSAASLAIRAQAALDPAGKQRTGVRA